MDVNDNLNSWSGKTVPLLFLAFFYKRPCQNDELKRQLDKLDQEVKPFLDTGYNGNCLIDSNVEIDGGLETDGHSSQMSVRSLLQDFLPQVDHEMPVNAPDVQVVREVAEEIIRIADEINHSIISQAAERLTKKLSSSSRSSWWNHLSEGVQSLQMEVPGIRTEWEQMALTFSLVKAVCELAPRLLLSLYNILMQHISFQRPR